MRSLPSYPEAESAILGGILLRGSSALAEIQSEVRVDEFLDPRHSAIYAAMQALVTRGEAVDVVTLEAQLRSTDELKLLPQGIGFLNRLGDLYATSYNIAHHARLVRRAAKQRQIILTCHEVADEAHESHENHDDWVNDAEQRVYKAFEREQKGTALGLPELAGILAKDQLGRRDPVTGARLEDPVVKTGYPSLDEALDGGFSPTDFVILAARPRVGKTAFVLNIGLRNAVPRWNQDVKVNPVQPVIMFSMEMSHLKIVRRVAGIEAGLLVSKLKRGELDEREMRILIREVDRVMRGQMVVDQQGGLSINEIRARLRRWRSDPRIFPPGGKQIGLAIVDYLQLANASGERVGRVPIGNREQEIATISRNLKAAAMELGIVVMGLSQLNRAVDARADHRPILSDLRESGAIENDADAILFVYREEVYLPPNATPEQRAPVQNKAEIIIGKARDGGSDVAHLHFFGETQRFEEPGHDERPPATLFREENWNP